MSYGSAVDRPRICIHCDLVTIRYIVAQGDFCECTGCYNEKRETVGLGGSQPLDYLSDIPDLKQRILR